MRWAVHFAIMGTTNEYRTSFGRSESKAPLGRRGRRWVDNIKIALYVSEMRLLTGFIWLRIA
jgi:hypothetical protein